MKLLAEGMKAPLFKAEASGGVTVSLKDLRGRYVVVYFYPKDDTPGCTTEACGIRDAYAEFKRRDVVVLGVSADPVKKHDRFIEKHGLPFTLIADADHRICEAYGVWGEKKFMGRTFMGIHRVTYLINPDGRIAKVWPKVKPAVHADEILSAMDELAGGR